MKSIQLGPIDLNLLRMFLLVYDTGSVSTAGARLGLSQPAASNALHRLRSRLDDPLFVRTKGGMVPTHYAQSIVDDVRNHLTGLYRALDHRQTFDPQSNETTFRFSISGLGEAMFLPQIVRQVLKSAPHCQFRNVSVTHDQLPDALTNGRTDLAIGILDIRQRGIKSQTLFKESYSVIAGAGLPRDRDRTLDLTKAKLVLPVPELTYAQELESWLSRRGLNQNIVVRLRHFGALAELLNEFDVIAIVPSQYASRLAISDRIRCLSEISELGKRDVRMIWHARSDFDVATRWFREQITQVLSEPAA